MTPKQERGIRMGHEGKVIIFSGLVTTFVCVVFYLWVMA